MTISYSPSNDELLLKFCPLPGKPNKVVDGIKLWWNKRGDICGITIERFVEQLKQFERRRNTIKIGGVWKDVKIMDKEIQDIRRSLLKKLEEKW